MQSHKCCYAATLLEVCFVWSCFLQLKSMFDSGRIWASLIYLGSIAGTLAVAFTVSGFMGVIGVHLCACKSALHGVGYHISPYMPVVLGLKWARDVGTAVSGTGCRSAACCGCVMGSSI
jgi:hypothetical protein